jgi:ribosomal protein S18 acetylase RimI-like enzyme
MQIMVEEHPEAADVQVVRRGLENFNTAHTGEVPTLLPLHIFMRDDDGHVLGGLLGGTYWGWLLIEVLWLDESTRGQGYGRTLVTMAEQIATARGCHSVHLDTMSFQALDFYLKLGYTVFGRLDDLPKDHSRIFLKKSLDSESAKH